MLTSALRILGRGVRRRIEAVRWVLYRWRMLRQGVEIDPRSHLVGVARIRLGRGTVILREATLTTLDVGSDERLAGGDKGTLFLGEDCRIRPGAILASCGGHIELGARVSVNPYAVLFGYGGLCIGDDTRIAAHTVIVASDHVFSEADRPIRTQPVTGKGIVIGRDVWLGAGVRVIDGVRIGDGAVVGAAAVVTRDVAPYDIVVGVPARKIGSRRPPETPAAPAAS
jgi:acetyltransferase-like isoleucine patch superfamily enzyme